MKSTCVASGPNWYEKPDVGNPGVSHKCKHAEMCGSISQKLQRTTNNTVLIQSSPEPTSYDELCTCENARDTASAHSHHFSGTCMCAGIESEPTNPPAAAALYVVMT